MRKEVSRGWWYVRTWKIGTEPRNKGHKIIWKVKDRTKSFKEKEKLQWTKEGRLRFLRHN